MEVRAQPEVLTAIGTKYTPPYNLSQVMKILFPGLIFSQTSLENTERPFSFSHILIFAY